MAVKVGINGFGRIGRLVARVLIQKIEELTLYMIDLKKDVTDLKQENRTLKNENEMLKEGNETLKKRISSLENAYYREVKNE